MDDEVKLPDPDTNKAYDDLCNKIVEIIARHWEKTSSAFLLSELGTSLVLEGISYKSVLMGTKLQAFIASELSSKISIISHPRKKAKIGLVPSGEIFEFEDNVENIGDENVKPEVILRNKTRRQNKYIVLDFIEALSDLPDAELDSINIPVAAFAKLLRVK